MEPNYTTSEKRLAEKKRGDQPESKKENRINRKEKGRREK